MVYKIEFYYGYYWTTHMLISEKRLFFNLDQILQLNNRSLKLKVLYQ